MNRRLVVVMLMTLIATTACQGPLAPLDIGSKEVPLDLLLGARRQVVAAPLPPIALPEDFFRAPTRAPSVPIVIPEEPLGPCPEADPLAVPKLIATNVVEKPPVEGTYLYRTEGKETTTTGSITNTSVKPATSTWKVQNILAEPASSTFDIAVGIGNVTTTSTYRILPMGAYQAPPNPPVAPPTQPPSDAPRPNAGVPPGLYLAGVSSPGSPALRLAFPGIPIVRFPIDRGATFDASGSDGNTTMSWRSVVGPKVTVDACGTPIDTYTVDLLNGRITTVGSQEVLTFTTNYALGTQYGGLPLFQKTTITGNQGTASVRREVTMTANVEPKTPK